MRDAGADRIAYVPDATDCFDLEPTTPSLDSPDFPRVRFRHHPLAFRRAVRRVVTRAFTPAVIIARALPA
jgi:hypothetical protein